MRCTWICGVASTLLLTPATSCSVAAQDPGKPLYDFQVTKLAIRLPDSAAPRYPEVLRMQGARGDVLVTFVVDTLGLADTTTFKVLRSTHDLFSQSVREALPRMRFSPAEVNGRKVLQVVQMPFVFAIQPGPGGTAPSAAPSAAPIESTILWDDATRTMTSLMPDQRRAMLLNRSSPLDLLTGQVRLEIAGVPEWAVEDLGAGEAILGHPTHRYRVTSSVNFRAAVAGQACTRTTKTVTDTWNTTDVDVPSTLQDMASSMAGTSGIAGDAMERLAVKRPNRMPGFSLRSVSRQTIGGSAAGALVVTLTAEVSGLARAAIPAATLAVPDGFTVVDVREQLARSRAMLDSLRAARPDMPSFQLPDSTVFRRFARLFCDPPPRPTRGERFPQPA